MFVTASAFEQPIKNTTQVDIYAPPVIALKTKNGIIMGAHMIGIQGSTFKFEDVNRF